MVRYTQSELVRVGDMLTIPPVVDISDNVDIAKLTVGKRVTLLSDSYKLSTLR